MVVIGYNQSEDTSIKIGQTNLILNKGVFPSKSIFVNCSYLMTSHFCIVIQCFGDLLIEIEMGLYFRIYCYNCDQL